jgi:hypothetical protein
MPVSTEKAPNQWAEIVKEHGGKMTVHRSQTGKAVVECVDMFQVFTDEPYEEWA